MNKKALVGLSAFAFATALPLAASAQQPNGNANCPPGSWFCADTQTAPAAPADQPVQPQPLQPLPSDEPSAAPAKPGQPQVIYQPPPPVVVYQPPPPVMVVREAPPPYVHTPPPPAWARRNEWGLNLHLAGAMIGRGNQGNTSMGGIGFGLRYRPVPGFAIEGDLDFAGGRDYSGYQRSETAFTFNGLFFLNPRSKAQVYLLAGFGWAGAKVQVDRQDGFYSDVERYGYFGGQLGAGLELRLAKHFALNLDVRGFIRGRTDSAAQYNPEFRDSNGRSTNTSGGGLVTGGMTFYF
jgi:hypothetical protein